MAVFVHRGKLPLAWLDYSDKSSLGSRSGHVQHLEQASRGSARRAPIWRQLILASAMRPAGMLTSLTWSARNAPQSHSPIILYSKSPRQDCYNIAPLRFLPTIFTDDYAIIVAGNDIVKAQSSTQTAKTVLYDASAFYIHHTTSPLPQLTYRGPSHQRTTFLVRGPP